jgi:hypothetical protein
MQSSIPARYTRIHNTGSKPRCLLELLIDAPSARLLVQHFKIGAFAA